MSIGKDVEEMYRKDAENQKKKQKKKKKNNAAILIILILMIIAVLLLLKYLGLLGGFGFGFGKGGSGGDNDGGADASVSVSSALEGNEAAEDESSEVTKEFENVKVSGSIYIYKGSIIELSEFIDIIGKMNPNVVVLIEDDNATQNAMEDIRAALEESERDYIIEETVESAAETESSSEASAE